MNVYLGCILKQWTYINKMVVVRCILSYKCYYLILYSHA